MFFKLIKTLDDEPNTEGLKIVYDDLAPYAKENSFPFIWHDGLVPYVGLVPGAGLVPRTYTEEEIPSLKRNDVTYPGYVLCLPRFALLNGQYINYPASNPLPYGYLSEVLSDEEGVLPDGTEISIRFNQKFTSVGVTLTFNDLSGDHVSELTMSWYEDDELLSSMDFTPTSAEFFCSNYVIHYNKITIQFKKTSKPYRPVFLTRIDYGVYRDFLSNETLDTNCIQEINAISENVSINTLTFTIRTRSNIPFDLQKKQRLGVYFNGDLIGNFYLKNGSRKNRTDYYFDSHDANGVLDGNEYAGGIYTGEKVPDVLDEIFSGEDFPYYLDDVYQNTQLYGYIPYTSKRNALVQIAFAIGAVVDTSNTDGVAIYPQQTDKTGEFTESETYDGVTLEHSDIVTGIRLTIHSYQKAEEAQELYNEALNGTAEIVFSEPYHDLSITGGTIEKSGANFAVVTGNGGTVTLTGKKYNHLKNQILKENPDIIFNKNIKEVTDATLIHGENAQQVLDRIYNYYQRAESVVGDVLLGDKKLGQVVSIRTGYDGERIGTIESVDYSFSQREIKARVNIHE